MDTNLVILTGHLCADPTSRFTPGGQETVNFRIGNNRSWKGADGQKKEKANFFNVTTWNGVAATCKQYLKEGRFVLVEGRLDIEEYVDKDGQKKYFTRITANRVQFLDGSQAGQQTQTDSEPPAMLPTEEIPF